MSHDDCISISIALELRVHSRHASDGPDRHFFKWGGSCILPQPRRTAWCDRMQPFQAFVLSAAFPLGAYVGNPFLTPPKLDGDRFNAERRSGEKDEISQDGGPGARTGGVIRLIRVFRRGCWPGFKTGHWAAESRGSIQYATARR
jgi:hypothetical protein